MAALVSSSNQLALACRYLSIPESIYDESNGFAREPIATVPEAATSFGWSTGPNFARLLVADDASQLVVGALGARAIVIDPIA
ncbi:MAG TPA: hypothetical protein VKD72_06240, partial [Gemmataceae bacterium]|nr:hypothetical protein [Gemmataceae bacterium]